LGCPWRVAAVVCVGCGDSCHLPPSMSGPVYLLRMSVRQPPGGVQSTELSSDSYEVLQVALEEPTRSRVSVFRLLRSTM